MPLVDRLKKDSIPGSPGTPSSPSTGGTGPTPAYCVSQPTTTYKSEFIYHGKWVYNDGTDFTHPVGWYFLGYVEAVSVPIVTYDQHCFDATTGSPPQQGDPGTSATPNQLRVGWNAGARLIQSIDTNTISDAQLTMVFSRAPVGIYIGIGTVDAQDNPNAIQFGYRIEGQTYWVVENGTEKSGPHQFTGTPSWSLHIWIRNHKVYYDIGTGFDPAAAYLSDNEIHGPAYCSACMYMSGDEVDEVSFLETSFLENFADGAGVLGGLSGFGLDDAADPGGYGYAVLTPIDVYEAEATTSIVIGTGTGVLGRVTGYGFDSTFTEDCQGVLPGLSGGGDAGLHVPSYAVGVAALRPLWGFGISSSVNAGNCEGTLNARLQGFGLDDTADPGGYGYGELNGVRANIISLADFNYAYMQLTGFGPGQVYKLVAFGHQDLDVRYGFFGELSGYSLRALGGANAKMALSGYTLASTGAVTLLANVAMRLSGYEFMATGTGVQLGRIRMALSGYDMYALGGANASMRLSGYNLSASGLRGLVANASLRYGSRHYGLVAVGHQGAYGSVAGVLGGLILSNQARVVASLSGYTLRALGEALQSAETEGYSHTLLDDGSTAVTRYTTLPFDYMLRFGDRYVGVSDTGLFEFTGNKFDDADINAVVETGVGDFGDPALKRARHLYLNGRITGNFQIEAKESNRTVDTFSAHFSQPLGNVRVTLGRGMQARYLSFVVSNAGQDFEIHEMGPEVDVLRRTA